MRKKLMAYILSSLLLFLITLTLLLTSIFNHQYEANSKEKLIMSNRLIKGALENSNKDHIEILKKDEFSNEPMRITFIDEEGTVLYDSHTDHETLENHSKREEIIEARENGEGHAVRYSSSVEKYMMYVAMEYDGYIIRTSLPLNYVNIFSGEYLQYYIVVFAIAILVSIWLANKLAYIFVKPISDLDVTTSRIANGDFKRRVTVRSNDEIGQLGKNFNHMADRLESTLNEVIDKQTTLEAILGSMYSGVIAVDRNCKVIMINPYAKNIFGIKKNVIGENLLDCVRNFDLEDILTSNSDEYKEFKILWPEERVLRIKTTDIINGNDHIGTVAVLQDITDIKRLESMRTQFVANVSHELKTPLTSIKGFAETLKEVDDTEIRMKFLKIIDDEAERLTRLINDILTLSHIEQQKEMILDKVDVNQNIQDVYNLIKESARKKEIDINLELGSISYILGDNDKFKQMMINLVDNAVKYSEKGDSVKVSTYSKDKNCCIVVEDTGVGIPKDNIPRLFERFYRVDKARSRAKGGTGLGLAIVKHIVLNFKGNIEVESEVGVGSKFKITIPYRKTTS